jgi:hypothetical protein
MLLANHGAGEVAFSHGDAADFTAASVIARSERYQFRQPGFDYYVGVLQPEEVNEPS